MIAVPQFESMYMPATEAIARRIIIAEGALHRVGADPNNPSSLGDCELAVLQLRLICELFLLGSTAAHLREGGLNVSDSKWRPKDAFFELSKVNGHPLPFPIELQLNKNGKGEHHVVPKSQPITYEALARIYGICGDLLHIPTIKQVTTGRLPEFDVTQLERWLAGFREIARAHALMLPERQVVLLCHWSGKVGELPEGFRLDAHGPSTLDVLSLPEFSLLQ